MSADGPRKQLLNAVFRLRGSEFSKCFCPTMDCKRPAIRAHSVQNASTLDLLAENGHVIAPQLRLDARKGPRTTLSKVGRNSATTFAGLCADHDRELFAPIEVAALDISNQQHRFLLAYRATFYEVHATAAAAWMVQSGYVESTRLGINPKDRPSPAGLFAVERIIVAWEAWKYKSQFDLAYLAGEFDVLSHDVLELAVSRPTVAASALFSLDDATRGDETVYVCITVLPVTKSSTFALLSYTNDDASLARKSLSDVLTTSGQEQQYRLSRRLVNHCQNFVLAPSFVASWSPERKKIVTDYFARTVFRNELTFEDPALMLFA